MSTQRFEARKVFRICIVAGWIALFAIGAYAGQVASRPALVTALGGPGTTETFENFTVGSGTAAGFNCATLNSAAVCSGQGPGLVQPGISFTFGTGGGQWDGPAYFGSTSKEILSGSPAGQPLTLTFSPPVQAFGVDLRSFTGFTPSATVTVYASNGSTVLGTIPGIALSSGGPTVFAGWQDSGGIGRVDFTETGTAWSPIIDNLEFGGAGVPATPIPATWILTLLGLAALVMYQTRSRRLRRT